jgi:hypothetical protein
VSDSERICAEEIPKQVRDDIFRENYVGSSSKEGIMG